MKTKFLFSLGAVFIVFIVLAIFFVSQKNVVPSEEQTTTTVGEYNVKSLCRLVWEDDRRVGPEIDAFFKPVEKTYLVGFKWLLVNKTTYADTMSGEGFDCRVVSHVSFSVPRLVFNMPLNFTVVVSYYTNDLTLGDNTSYGPSFGDAERALDSAILKVRDDARFMEVLGRGFNDISYAYEDDTITVSGTDYEMYYILGGGPQRGHYPPQRNFMMTYYLYKIYGFPEVIFSRQKAEEALALVNQQKNLSCPLSYNVITDTFNHENNSLHVVSWRLNDTLICPCKIEVTLKEDYGKLTHVNSTTLYSGPRGCP